MAIRTQTPEEALRQRRDYAGPAFLEHGFRPFFLGAGLWAAMAILIWLLMFAGSQAFPSIPDPLTWHVHEMIFGYAAAAMAGFMLTAIPNWTGRLPVRGNPLLILFGLWCAGRVAMVLQGSIGPVAAAAVDMAFLTVLVGMVALEIAAGKNWRNLPVAGAAGLLAFANLLMHIEYLGVAETAAAGSRLGIATLIAMISLIGGRVVPSFTRNWLGKRGADSLPAPFGGLDKAALALTAAAGLAWTVAPYWTGTGLLAVIAAVLHAIRLVRWRGRDTLAEPLVWILHLGYAWVPVGFALLALSILSDIYPQSAAVHALTVGAIGTMTLAVMSRAILGHTGRALTANGAVTLVYALVTLAAVLRVLYPLAGAAAVPVLHTAGAFWVAAFLLFSVIFFPMLTGPTNSKVSA